MSIPHSVHYKPVLISSTGLLQLRDRPTYYSPSSRTALAEAELKYQDDFTSQSVYVYFPVKAEDMSAGFKKAWEKVGSRKEIGLAVWTTTAWTLAANQVSGLLLEHSDSAQSCGIGCGYRERYGIRHC